MDNVSFCRDWNAGLTVVDMSAKYKLSVASVRSRVASFRKQGVNLMPRRAKGIPKLSEKEVATINRSL